MNELILNAVILLIGGGALWFFLYQANKDSKKSINRLHRIDSKHKVEDKPTVITHVKEPSRY